MSNHLAGAEQIGDKPSKKAPQSSVTFIYSAKIAELFCDVSVIWSRSVTNHFLTINVENPDDQNHYSCKIELKTWQFWGKKGLKSFEVDGRRLDVYWDFRLARFSSNPEPCSNYYVALVNNEEVVLVIGDLKDDAYKRTKKKPTLTEPTFLCKKENVYGKNMFCAKTMLDNSDQEHDLIIETSLGYGDPEMWISIDGLQVIHLMNLHWRFRGNESVPVTNKITIDIFWDVHDWIFPGIGTGHGLFILKPRTVTADCNFDSVNNEERYYDADHNEQSDLSAELPSDQDFFHFIYAWRHEHGNMGS